MPPYTICSIVLCICKHYWNAIIMSVFFYNLLVLLNIVVRVIHVHISSSGSLKVHSCFYDCVVITSYEIAPIHLLIFFFIRWFPALAIKTRHLWLLSEVPYPLSICLLPSHCSSSKSTESSLISGWSSHHFYREKQGKWGLLRVAWWGSRARIWTYSTFFPSYLV